MGKIKKVFIPVFRVFCKGVFPIGNWQLATDFSCHLVAKFLLIRVYAR